MILIVCGEDIIASRNYFFNLKKQYRKNGVETQEINPNQIEEINKWLGDSLSLFSSKKVFFTQGLNKRINKKSSIKDLVESYSKSKYIEIINWEEGTSARELKFGKSVLIKEFKPEQTIFKLVDNCYPNNFSVFFRSLKNLPDKVEDGFIFFMLTKHLRNLLIVKSGKKPAKMLDWQVWKLQKQAKFWTLVKLISFYEGLHRIDIITKTSNNPFSLRQSLDILAYYLL